MVEVESGEPIVIKETYENCGSCNDLKLELEKSKSECKALEAKLRNLEAEIMALHAEGLEGKGRASADVVIDLVEEERVEVGEDKIFQLMIENKVLECEKNRAEREVERWKVKFKDLELQLLQMNGEVNCEETPNGNVNLDGCQCTDKGTVLVDDEPQLNGSPPSMSGKMESDLKPDGLRSKLIRKRLIYEEQRSPRKRMAPSTPSGLKPVFHGVIDICDSDDDESDGAHTRLDLPDYQGKEKAEILTASLLDGTDNDEVGKGLEDYSQETVNDENYEDDADACRDETGGVSTPKRKRGSVVVSSDSESDEDNVPICNLKAMHLKGSGHNKMNNCSIITSTPMAVDVDNTARPSRRRLVKLSQNEEKCSAESSFNVSKTKCQPGIPTTGNPEDIESEEAGSDSESGSMNSFIVDTSEMSTEEQSSGHSRDGSDEDVDFDDILSTIKRQKDRKLNWEFEADMLADFGKDTELCMRAVCALFRQQTAEEQFSKGTFIRNGRGFSKLDADRGSRLAVFITGGDPLGDVKRSVQELQEYDSKAIEDCRRFAARYSKQLFEIYKNKEDPLFLS